MTSAYLEGECNELAAFYQSLKELVDPVPQYVGRRLTTWRCRSYPAWVPWAIVIVAGLLTQQLIASLIVPVR